MSDSMLATSLAGAYVLRLPRFDDDRGAFLRAFDAALPDPAVAPFHPQEMFFSRSAAGVIRGMHFQAPPAQQKKIVFCLAGRVVDVLLDLRKESATFGQVWSVELDAFEPRAVLVPFGVAHGFASLAESSVVGYAIDGKYSPAHDRGVHWESFGFDWPVAAPVVSPKDSVLPSFANYVSPF